MTDIAERTGPAPSDLTVREAELLDHVEGLERLFDQRYRIPGTPIRFGFDAILGLVPVAGDTASAAASVYLIWLAHRIGADSKLKRRMAGNVLVDYLIGIVPLIGNVGDVFFKANTRNVRLLKEHLRKKGRPHSPGSQAPASRRH